jgi:hypothetical protein
LGGRGLRSSPREAALVTIVRIILSYRTRHRVTRISVSDSVIRYRDNERDDERISLPVEPL